VIVLEVMASKNEAQNESIDKPRAVQIIEIDSEGGTMELHESELKKILFKIPDGVHVSIVSVVGAFRLGKSFLLDCMLYYLKNMKDSSSAKFTDEPGVLPGGPMSDAAGFSWRPGSVRNTTGIWMWNEHFIQTNPKTGEKVAVLLMDTQGMFDGVTTQVLTTQIFGVSTLLSSYQIYNVSKQIQEDHMQHLALFAEYGRLAVGHSSDKDAQVAASKGSTAVASSSSQSQASGEAGAENATIDAFSSTEEKRPPAPFQMLDFCIRDWQNFEDEEDIEGCIQSMPKYLASKMKRMEAAHGEDMNATRDQIDACFQDVECFLLPHPGFKVTKKTPPFSGKFSEVREEFRDLIKAYFQKLFNSSRPAKIINGRSLTGSELFRYAVQYVDLFKTKGMFPEAKTLLAATAYACNMNAKEAAYKKYKADMDKKAGPEKAYMGPIDLEDYHRKCELRAQQEFSRIATVGAVQNIQKFKVLLMADIDALWSDYLKSNANKDPYKNFEYYIIPGAVALMAYVLRKVSDITCMVSPQTEEFDFEYADVCLRASNFLFHVYWAVFFFCGLVFVAKGNAAMKYFNMFYAMAKSGVPSAAPAPVKDKNA